MASTTVKAERLRCQGQTGSQPAEGQGTSVTPSPLLLLIRESIDVTGWKHEALAAHIGLPSGQYLSRMLAGEKPWTSRHMVALPIEIKREVVKRAAAAVGLICVEPLNHDAAVQQCVAGLLSLLIPRPQAVKVDVRVEQKANVA